MSTTESTTARIPSIRPPPPTQAPPVGPACTDDRIDCSLKPNLCVGIYAPVYTKQCRQTCKLC